MYRSTPPWDIGRPQPAIVELEDEGEILGEVVDLGCGTGENALFLAERGHTVMGVDSAPTAIERARAKAEARTLSARFECVDAFRIGTLGRTFETAIDCGLFHTFTDEERPRYASAVRDALADHGRIHILCFSEKEPSGWGGPRRVTEAELREAFRDGFTVRAIRPTRFETRMPEIEGHAWRASFERDGRAPDRPSGRR